MRTALILGRRRFLHRGRFEGIGISTGRYRELIYMGVFSIGDAGFVTG
jgi:hypothetical protein